MRNNLRNLLSVPVLAIAAMALTTTSADAQCPGGCFGYPTPRPSVRTFVPAVQFQQVQVVPVQTFVQQETFVQPEVFPVPEFVPAQPEFIPVPQQFTPAPQQLIPQPQQLIPAPQQFVPTPQQFVPAPVQQTFTSQPAIVESGVTGVPQSLPQSGLPAGAFNVHPILPNQSGLPVPSGVPVQQPVEIGPNGQAIPPVTIPMDANDGGEEENSKDNVQEGQIEGEIISPDDNDSSTSVMDQDNLDSVPLLAASGLAAEQEAQEAAMEKAEMEEAAMEEAAMEEAALEKAAMEKAEMEKAEMEKAEMEKAEMEKAEMEAAERKAAMERAAERKAAEEKASKKVLTEEERIAKLENSLKRQMKRAKQVSKRDLEDRLEELKAVDATEAVIEATKLESAAVLKAKLAEIETRVQARIDQLKN